MRNSKLKVIKKSLEEPHVDKKGSAKLLVQYDLSENTAREHVLKAYEKLYQRILEKDNFEILELFLSTLARTYDPHSAYMAPVTKENFDISMKHSLEGIGARLMADEGYVKITEIIAGGPADRDGRLKAGDLIVSVAQEHEESVNIANMSLRKVVSLIRGPKGSVVTLTAIEGGKDLSLPKKNIDLVRDKINLVDRGAKMQLLQASSEMNDKSRMPETKNSAPVAKNKIAFISLRSFYTDFDKRRQGTKRYTSSTRDVLELIQQAKQKHASALILDLRSNSGGSLDEAVSLAGLFIADGLVVQVRYRNAKKTVLRDDDSEVHYNGPLVVLVDRFSASASEIFAAAIQDYRRGIVIGERSTYGKGTVQTLHSLNRLVGNRSLLGSLKPGSVKITTAKFYRVNGGSTQEKGVIPDLVIPSFRDTMEIGESSLPTALAWDRVEPAHIQTNLDFGPYLSTIKKRFDGRIKSYDWYKKLVVDIDLYAEYIKQNSVPLNIEKRSKRKAKKKNGQGE